MVEDITLNNRLYRLNGYCGTTQPGHIGKEFTETFETKAKMSDVLLQLYADYTISGAEPDINFSWEMNENYFNKKIFNVTSNVKAVIVIGYSFPFFNREVDKKIFDRLGDMENIYVQTPYDSFPGIKERIKTISPELPEPKLVQDTSQFFIPFDYNL